MELASGLKWTRSMTVEPGRAVAAAAAAAAASMDCYDGSRVFSWLADLAGLPIDQVGGAAACEARIVRSRAGALRLALLVAV